MNVASSGSHVSRLTFQLHLLSVQAKLLAESITTASKNETMHTLTAHITGSAIGTITDVEIKNLCLVFSQLCFTPDSGILVRSPDMSLLSFPLPAQ